MKHLSKIFVIAAVLFTTSAWSQKTTWPKLYAEAKDRDSTKMLLGFVDRAQITNDTAFGWYANTLKYFKPNAEAVSTIKGKTDSMYILLFAGTWCEDSQQILPKYLSTLDAAGLPADRVTIIATDRAKTTVANLHKTFGITNVPTLIMLKQGKEVGRIVEYGSTALMDKELAALAEKM
jgi:thiol-disulfide isomerase/thioredoxin